MQLTLDFAKGGHLDVVEYETLGLTGYAMSTNC